MLTALGDFVATASAWVLLIQDVATSAVELADKRLQGKQEAERETSRVRRFKLYVCSFFQLTAVSAR